MITLRPHQESAVYALQNNTKGQVIMPTGSGKTMVAINNAQEAFNSCKWDVFLKNPERKTIIVVAPRILLAQQLCEDFLEYLKTHPMLKHKDNLLVKKQFLKHYKEMIEFIDIS